MFLQFAPNITPCQLWFTIHSIVVNKKIRLCSEIPICCVICGRPLFRIDKKAMKYISIDNEIINSFRERFGFLPPSINGLYATCICHESLGDKDSTNKQQTWHRRNVPELLKHLNYKDQMECGLIVPSIKWRQGRSLSNNSLGLLIFTGECLLPINSDLNTENELLFGDFPCLVVKQARDWLLQNNCLYQKVLNRTLNIHARNEDAMAMIWPQLFPYGIGHFRSHQRIKDYTIQLWAKRNLFCLDGRFLKCPQFWYYLFIQQELNRAFSQAECRRTSYKYVMNNPDCVAGDFLDSKRYQYNSLTSIPITSGFRMSTAYKVDCYLDLNAIMYRYGDPTLFITLSSNFWNWPEMEALFRLYKKYNSDITKRDMGSFLPFVFRRRLQTVMHFITHKWAELVGGIEWYYYVFEQNANGLLHVHIVLRTGMSPEKLLYHNAIASSRLNCFTDKQFHLMQRYQRHNCTSYCLVRGKCRFNYPREIYLGKSEIQEDGHVLYTCQNEVEAKLSPCILPILEIMDSSMNAQVIPLGFASSYLNKYFTKEDSRKNALIPIDPGNPHSSARQSVADYLSELDIGIPFISMNIFGLHMKVSTVACKYINPRVNAQKLGVLKRKHDLMLDPHSEDFVLQTDTIKYLMRTQWLNYTFPYYRMYITDKKKHRTKPIVIRSFFYHPGDKEKYYHQQLLFTIPMKCNRKDQFENLYTMGEVSFEDAYKKFYGIITFHIPGLPSFTDMQRMKRIVLHKSSVSGSLQLEKKARKTIIFTEEQRSMMDWILGDNESKVCLGVPGSGKSTILRELASVYKQSGRKVIVLAPTGIVSLAYDGRTLHSFFRMATKGKYGKVPLVISNIHDWEQLGFHPDEKENLVFLIDECGQISAQMHSCMNQKMKFLFDNREYFGGVKVVWFGDFFQCENPEGDMIFKDQEFLSLGTKELKNSLRCDNRLHHLLNLIREDEDNVEEIWQLILPCLRRPANTDYVTMFPTRKQVYEYLDRQSDKHVISFGSVLFHLLPNSSEKHNEAHFHRQADLELDLNVYLGMRILMTKNFDIGLWQIRNGMFGNVIAIEDDFLTVILEHYPGLQFTFGRYVWVCPNTGVHIAQFPVLDASALTIARVQSTTQDGINICLTPNFGYALPISGLGRSKSLDTISIIGEIDIRKWKQVPEDLREYYNYKNLI